MRRSGVRLPKATPAPLVSASLADLRRSSWGVRGANDVSEIISAGRIVAPLMPVEVRSHTSWTLLACDSAQAGQPISGAGGGEYPGLFGCWRRTTAVGQVR